MALRAIIFDVDGTLGQYRARRASPGVQCGICRTRAVPGTGTRLSTARCSKWPAAWSGFVTTPSSSIRQRSARARLRRPAASHPRHQDAKLPAAARRRRDSAARRHRPVDLRRAHRRRTPCNRIELEAGECGRPAARQPRAPTPTPGSTPSLRATVPAAKKPSPELYLWTLKQLNLPARDCLAVEDSAHGLTAALAAGIPTVITVSDYTINENFDGARMVLPNRPGVTWTSCVCGTPPPARPDTRCAAGTGRFSGLLCRSPAHHGGAPHVTDAGGDGHHQVTIFQAALP
jgi:phosphoglycolate phosphatase-like HAD superfamily hydrolase